MRRVVCYAIVALVLGGCSSSPEPPKARPQRLTTANISDPKTFNPITSIDQSSAAAVGDLFEGLVRTNPLTTEQEPFLAEKWEFNKDGTEWTFHLRRDVKWHDGQPFTAADVVFTFDVIFDDRVANSLKHVLLVDGQRIKVDAIDDYTVRFTLPRPFAPLINAIGAGILPKHILGASLKDGSFAQKWGIDTPPEQLVGTGPFQMTRYVPAQFLEYKRNANYWMKDDAGKELPYLETKIQLIVPDQDTMYLKFVSGQTDWHAPRPEEVAELRTKAEQLNINVQETGLDTGSTFVAFNRNPAHYVRDGKRDPRLVWFTDKRFLRAIAHAIDKQSMIVNCLNGYGKPAIAEVSPENKLYHNPNLTDYPYDLDKAKALLDEAGYKDRNNDGVREDPEGNPLEFSLTTNAGNQVREKMCSILKEDWTKLGIRVNYRPLDFQTLVEKVNSNFDWDAILIGFTGTIEPNNSANFLRSSGNLHFWQPSQAEPATPWEAEIDQLLDQGSRELDPQKRRQFYWRIQEILHEELPVLLTVRDQRFLAYKRYIANVRPTAWGLYREELLRISE
ncbi:MAG: ABC transporter substrate-binding protein [Deltaproteobacteria bacterium]|nr:ABC transporter substrate-binding protein [Deltaproteobacteria bacterium]